MPILSTQGFLRQHRTEFIQCCLRAKILLRRSEIKVAEKKRSGFMESIIEAQRERAAKEIRRLSPVFDADLKTDRLSNDISTADLRDL